MTEIKQTSASSQLQIDTHCSKCQSIIQQHDHHMRLNIETDRFEPVCYNCYIQVK